MPSLGRGSVSRCGLREKLHRHCHSEEHRDEASLVSAQGEGEILRLRGVHSELIEGRRLRMPFSWLHCQTALLPVIASRMGLCQQRGSLLSPRQMKHSDMPSCLAT